jgi:homoserine/homoserine lactone efflux protein
MSVDTWLLYLLASIGLSLSPGPNGLLALTHGVLHGQRKTCFTTMVMASTFAVTEAITELLIAGMAGRISPWLRRVGSPFNQVCGGVFVAIGLALPLRS